MFNQNTKSFSFFISILIFCIQNFLNYVKNQNFYYTYKQMTSFFQALRNFRLQKFPPPPPQPSPSQYQNGIFLSKRFKQTKQQSHRQISSQSSLSKSKSTKDQVKKIIGKARLDSKEYGRFTFYLVKWKSKTLKQATWQHPQHLQQAVSKIVPFNIKIKDKPLPYFDPKYIMVQPNYQQILEDFVSNFLLKKDTQRQNSEEIKSQNSNFQIKTYSQSSRKNKAEKTKGIKKQMQNEKGPVRELKIMITQRCRQNPQKQEKIKLHYRNEKINQSQKNKNDHEFYNIGNHIHKKNLNYKEKKNYKIKKNPNTRQNYKHLKQQNSSNFNNKKRFNQKEIEKTQQPKRPYWTWPNNQPRYLESDENQESFQKNKNQKISQLPKKSYHKLSNAQNVQSKSNHQFLNQAIRQSFYSRIRSSSSFKNQTIQEQEIEVGEILDSPQFSKNSDSLQIDDELSQEMLGSWAKALKQQKVTNILNFQTKKTRNMTVYPESLNNNFEKKQDFQLKNQYKQTFFIGNEEQLQSGELILDQKELIYSKFITIEQGQMTKIDFFHSNKY